MWKPDVWRCGTDILCFFSLHYSRLHASIHFPICTTKRDKVCSQCKLLVCFELLDFREVDIDRFLKVQQELSKRESSTQQVFSPKTASETPVNLNILEVTKKNVSLHRKGIIFGWVLCQQDHISITYNSTPYGFSIKTDDFGKNTVIFDIQSDLLRTEGLKPGNAIVQVNNTDLIIRKLSRKSREFHFQKR